MPNVLRRMRSASDGAWSAIQQLARHSELLTWKKGTLDTRGQPHGDSGATLPLCETASLTEALAATADKLNRMRGQLAQLETAGFSFELDVGIVTDENVERSLTVPSTLLGALSALGIDLRVSVYNVGDDEG